MQGTPRGYKAYVTVEASKNPDHTTEEIYIPKMYLEGQDRQRCLLSIKVSLLTICEYVARYLTNKVHMEQGRFRGSRKPLNPLGLSSPACTARNFF